MRIVSCHAVREQVGAGDIAIPEGRFRRKSFSPYAFAALGTAILLAGCAHKPSVPPSQGHLNAAQVTAKSPDDKILQPVTASNFVPPPKPQVRLPTYSVVVNEVPVKELLFALSRDTKQNIDVHPSVQGLVTLNAIDETLPAILERVAQQVNIRYRSEGRTLLVMPDTAYFKTYKVNYVNISRDTASSIGVSGEISGDVITGKSQESANTSNSKVDSKSVNNFWETLRQNLESILQATKAATLSAEQRSAQVETAKAARDERIAQAEAVSRAGTNAASLFSAAFGAPGSTPGDSKNDIVVNPITGTISVLGTDKQQGLVQQYLDSVTSASQRQVLIEATIAEVRLSNDYQAGVDWSRIASATGFTLQQQLTGSNLASAPRMVVGYANATSNLGNIALSLKLLEQFGNTRVLSSPKLMALNNQTALLKVVDNLVYFALEATTTTSGNGPAVTTFSSKARTVPVGLVMSVLPQITESGQVNLTVRPTISRKLRDVKDPNPTLATVNVVSFVPEIQIREMESVLQVGSGQTIILGGLMQDNTRRDKDSVPGLGRLPSPAGDAFSYRDESVSKTELIVFLKPTVITSPSIDSDELKFFQRFLPVIDSTGKNP